MSPHTPPVTPNADQLELSWDQVRQLAREHLRPQENRSRRRAPAAKARLFYDLWRIEQLSQRQIAKRYKTSQSAVSRACQAVEKWLGSATQEELRELPAEEKFRAAVRIHERKVRYAERKLLRDYRQSSAPQVAKKTCVRKQADGSQGELERWEETVEKPQRRDSRHLERYVKLSRDELALAGRRLPMNVRAEPSLPFEASADEVRQSEQRVQQLVEELEILHREYVERLVNHQRIYGYMDRYGLKRQYVPASPLGDCVQLEDFSARRDQPGVFTRGQRYEDVVSGESVFGPPEQWQPGTPEWFDRLRAQAAAAGGRGSAFGVQGSVAEGGDQEPGDRDQASGGEDKSGTEGEGAREREGEGESMTNDEGPMTREIPNPKSEIPNASLDTLHSADPLVRVPRIPHSQADSLPASTPRAESPQNGENPRENAADSVSHESRQTDSKTESLGASGSPGRGVEPRRRRLTQAERWERKERRLAERAAGYERDRALEALRKQRQAPLTAPEPPSASRSPKS